MSTSALEQFIKKCQTAKNYNSKEIRLTIQEAEELSVSIALALTESTALKDKIIALQQQALDQNTDIKVSGGGFL